MERLSHQLSTSNSQLSTPDYLTRQEPLFIFQVAPTLSVAAPAPTSA
jgi:hypothetical protein